MIDDDPEFSAVLRGQLQRCGHEVDTLDLAEDGLRLLAVKEFDLVLLDNLMPRMSGLEFLKALKDQGVRVPVILMTSAPNDHTVIQATKMGAFAYVIKPLDFDAIMLELEPEIRDALDLGRRPAPIPLPKPNSAAGQDASLIVGQSKPMLKVFQRIAEVTEVDGSVLILGETGTGKDLVAQAIHTNSPRKNSPFVVVNCPTLTENLLASELFGHERSAFTGADKMRKGHFEHADGGTIFLDEIGELPLKLQAQLLRVLENRVITRIGSNEPIKVDVRVLAATHRPLLSLVQEGTFREDLYYRLAGETIHLPPLRERKEDLEKLALRFLRPGVDAADPAPRLHPDALEALRNHPWKGNVRELRNVMHCAARALRRRSRSGHGPWVMPEDLEFGEPTTSPPPAPTSAALSEDDALAGLCRAVAWYWKSDQPELWPLLERKLQEELLRFALAQRPRLSDVKLAKRLGMARNTLIDRREKFGLHEPPVDE